MATPISWEVRPSNTRWLRVLGYAITGLFGGLLLATAFLFVPDLIGGLVRGSGLARWQLGAFAVIVLLLGPMLWGGMRNARVAHERFSLAREWHGVHLSRWSLLATLSVFGLLVSIEYFLRGVVSANVFSFTFGILAITILLTLLASSLTSVGEIDPESMTFMENEQDEYDLAYLREVERVAVGPYSLVLLLFARAYDDRKAAQDLYVLPTTVTDRAMSIFESGITADIGSPKEPGRFRRVNLFVLFVAVVVAVVPFPLFFWLGMPLYMYLQYLYLSGGIVFVFTTFVIRTL